MDWRRALPARARLVLRPAYPLYRALQLWSEAGGARMSAAVSFYGILSLAPLLLVLVALLGWWMDRQMLAQTLVGEVRELVGPQGAAAVQHALASTREPAQGLLATLAGFGVLLFGATSVFGELQEAFARVWSRGGEPARAPWWRSIALRLRGVTYILAFGFLLLASLVVSTVLTVFSGWLGDAWYIETLLRLLNELVAFALCTALFVALMRLSGGRKPRLRFLVLGAAFGTLLFSLGRQLLAWYLSTAVAVSAYGAAGSLVVLLMWMYFSSGVLLFAASCAKAAEESKQTAAEVQPAAVDPPAEPPLAGGRPHLRAVAGTSLAQRRSDARSSQRRS